MEGRMSDNLLPAFLLKRLPGLSLDSGNRGYPSKIAPR